MLEVKDIDFLRNDHQVNIIVAGITYPSVEHAYQACKTNDIDTKKQIAYEPSPRKARKIGREAKLIDKWNEKKLDIMEMLIRQKFFSDETLQDQLIETGSAPLQMVRDNDPFWGVDDQGKGDNHLGKILEKIRAEAQFIRGWSEDPLTDDPAIQLVLDQVKKLVDLLNGSFEEDELFDLLNVPQEGVLGIIDKRRLARSLLDLETAYLALSAQ
jgi:N-glycosidase YbiA